MKSSPFPTKPTSGEGVHTKRKQRKRRGKRLDKKKEKNKEVVNVTESKEGRSNVNVKDEDLEGKEF